MTATMYNPKNSVVITGVEVSYIFRWIELGFKVVKYDKGEADPVYKAG